jgi:hypothetical protein
MDLGNAANGLFLAAAGGLNEIGNHDCRLARRPREASCARQTFEGFDFRRAWDGTRSEASTAAGASVLRPGGVSMITRSQSAAWARLSVSSRSFSVVNWTKGRASSRERRRRQFVEFCWVSMSTMRTARPDLAAAVARLRDIIVFPAPPLLIVTAIVFMPVCA